RPRRGFSAPARDVVEKGLLVYVHITGRLDDGTVFDDSDERGGPLVYIQGAGQVPRGLEAGVEGMRVGEARELRLQPAEAFGEADPDLVREVAVENLPDGCEVGTRLSVSVPGAEEARPAVVRAIGSKTATLDVNHQLAGKILNYSVRLVRCTELPQLSLEIQTPGDGKTYPVPGDQVTVHYTGSIAESGEEFDSSRSRAPFTFTIGLGQVIKGWDEGLQRMSLGERATLRVPSEMAYGDRGRPPIPPDADLLFDVEVLGVEPRGAS
ncbi:unnamed protein product, partial [Prorocentrum cordatum]